MVLVLVAVVADPHSGAVEPVAVVPMVDRGDDTARDVVHTHPGSRAVVLPVAVHADRQPDGRDVADAIDTALASVAASWAGDCARPRCRVCGYPVLTAGRPGPVCDYC